jgi:hypothetical protein
MTSLAPLAAEPLATAPDVPDMAPRATAPALAPAVVAAAPPLAPERYGAPAPLGTPKLLLPAPAVLAAPLASPEGGSLPELAPLVRPPQAVTAKSRNAVSDLGTLLRTDGAGMRPLIVASKLRPSL